MYKYRLYYDNSIKKFRQRTPISYELNKKASQYMPGGETRSICYHKPYPLTIEEAKGAYLLDVDGNKYIDLLNNYTAMIHGHANNKINENVQNAQLTGTAYASTILEQIEFSELLCKRIPGVEKVRFCNSGTEATMFAIRAAKKFTKKSSIIKIEGSYHGTHDIALWEPNKSNLHLEHLSESVFVVPFNNADRIEKVLKSKGNEIAAIIVEPVMGVAGVIPPQRDYLNNLRILADKYSVVLIFDEVQTLRLNSGGAQKKYGVIPDLTTMAKIIGGGYPVGAFGGRKEIMDLFNPNNENYLAHGGTFNGNKISMIAGMTAMNLLDDNQINKINNLTKMLKNRLLAIRDSLNLKISFTKVGSMMNIHFTKNEPVDYASTLHSKKDLIKIMHLELLNEGIFIAPRGLINISTATTESDIKIVANAFENVLNNMKELL